MYAPVPVLNGGLRRHSGSPPAGEDDVLCFFAVINDAGDYPILSAYRACRDARRRVETGVSPTPKGGCGGHPPHIRAYTRNRFFAYQPQVARRREPPPMPFAHCRFILRVSSLIRALQGRTPACGKGVSPCQKGGAEGIPIRLPIFRYALLWCAAHSVTHLMCAPSFAPSTPRLPKNILRSPTTRVHAQQILRIPATGYSAA